LLKTTSILLVLTAAEMEAEAARAIESLLSLLFAVAIDFDFEIVEISDLTGVGLVAILTLAISPVSVMKTAGILVESVTMMRSGR